MEQELLQISQLEAETKDLASQLSLDCCARRSD